MKPLAIDLCCGLGGWTEGLLAEGWNVVGFDIERHKYGDHQYPAQLVLQDILTLTGEQFRGKASLIVASPPCQKYSYMAMPWSRAKTLQAWYRDPEHPERIVELNALFDACVRIGKEAQCPTIIENVRGAQQWVGRARWMYGSFALWGDVPALMPPAVRTHKFNPDGTNHGQGSWFAIADSKNRGAKVPGFRFDGSGRSFQTASVNVNGRKTSGMNWSDQSKRGQDFTRIAGRQALEGIKGVPHRTKGHWTNPAEHHSDENGRKIGGDWFSDPQSTCHRHGSKSKSRKMASAMIAKIPLPLSRHIAAIFKPVRAA